MEGQNFMPTSQKWFYVRGSKKVNVDSETYIYYFRYPSKLNPLSILVCPIDFAPSLFYGNCLLFLLNLSLSILTTQFFSSIYFVLFSYSSTQFSFPLIFTQKASLHPLPFVAHLVEMGSELENKTKYKWMLGISG